MEDRKELFTKLLADETGQPPTIIETMHWMGSMGALNFFAGAAVDQVKWKETRNGSYGQTIVHREPVGVVGAIMAWNVPLFLAVNKLGPALLAGCTVVLKPAAETPLTRQRFGGGVRRGRPARGCAVGGARRDRDRAGADVQPGHRHVHVHRQLGRRQGGRQARRRHAQAVHAWSSAASRRPSCSRTSTWPPRCR